MRITTWVDPPRAEDRELPASPIATKDPSTDVGNLILFNGAVAQHAKRDEQIRTLGSLVAKVVGTPVYQGQGQPSADNGGSWFGRLGSLFGAGTPSYAGVRQRTSGSGGGSTVAYAAAPTAPPTENETYDASAPTCPIDPEALAAGHIAIVVPRER